MAEGSIAYAQLVEAALMGVVRRVLADAARDGIEPPHHFYITFRTDHPDVDMPAELRQRYRQEMTIVLQHQFWDLEVTDDAFSVTLKFHGQPNRLHIPFTAITAFGDPSVNFGLQLRINRDDGEAETTARALPATRTNAAGDESPEPASGEVIALDTFRKK